jgi:4,5-dihydroxyphthalate decarboxylase
MERTYSVAVREYPHTAALRAGKRDDLEIVDIDPIYKAFAPMVREQRFDVCEMAIATFLQAREAGKPISLLPIVMSGNFHHHSLTRWSGAPAVRPEELAGRRVGVRAYTQTTGLWVRGVLAEEYGVRAQDVTWVTTEGPHVAEYLEPDNVVRSESTLVELLRAGEIAAAIRGPIALDGGEACVPVIDGWREAEAAWHERHGCVPINHVLTVRTELLESEPGAVASIYRSFCQGIDGAAGAGGMARAVGHGVEQMTPALELAIAYACDQGLLEGPVAVADLFEEFTQHVGA